MPRRIGTLAEKSLHAALKAIYAQPGDSLEYALDGYVIDIVRWSEDRSRVQQCIEIQTRSLGKMKPKLTALLDTYPIHVVVPLAQERFIVRANPDGEILSRRKSPKHSSVIHLFPELVSFPALVTHPNFSMDVVLTREEEVWLNNGEGSWRRKYWSIQDRHLLEIVRTVPLVSPADFAALLPAGLPEIFDCGELASGLRQPRYIAQKMAYCLREMGVLQITGKRRNALLYRAVSRLPGC